LFTCREIGLNDADENLFTTRAYNNDKHFNRFFNGSPFDRLELKLRQNDIVIAACDWQAVECFDAQLTPHEFTKLVGSFVTVLYDCRLINPKEELGMKMSVLLSGLFELMCALNVGVPCKAKAIKLIDSHMKNGLELATQISNAKCGFVRQMMVMMPDRKDFKGRKARFFRELAYAMISFITTPYIATVYKIYDKTEAIIKSKVTLMLCLKRKWGGLAKMFFKLISVHGFGNAKEFNYKETVVLSSHSQRGAQMRLVKEWQDNVWNNNWHNIYKYNPVKGVPLSFLAYRRRGIRS
jgi:hypothetical protein